MSRGPTTTSENQGGDNTKSSNGLSLDKWSGVRVKNYTTHVTLNAQLVRRFWQSVWWWRCTPECSTMKDVFQTGTASTKYSRSQTVLHPFWLIRVSGMEEQEFQSKVPTWQQRCRWGGGFWWHEADQRGREVGRARRGDLSKGEAEGGSRNYNWHPSSRALGVWVSLWEGRKSVAVECRRVNNHAHTQSSTLFAANWDTSTRKKHKDACNLRATVNDYKTKMIFFMR